jgi:hypothetical protein
MLSRGQSGGVGGRGGLFGRRSVLTRRDTFFHESVTSHQKTKTPIAQIAPRTIAKANIFFTLVAIAWRARCRCNEKLRPLSRCCRGLVWPVYSTQLAALVPLVLRSVYADDRAPSRPPAAKPLASTTANSASAGCADAFEAEPFFLDEEGRMRGRQGHARARNRSRRIYQSVFVDKQIERQLGFPAASSRHGSRKGRRMARGQFRSDRRRIDCGSQHKIFLIVTAAGASASYHGHTPLI